MIHLYGSNQYSELRFQKMTESWIYFGKKYGYDYKKKLRYEYRILKAKKLLLQILNKNIGDLNNFIFSFESLYGDIVLPKL